MKDTGKKVLRKGFTSGTSAAAGAKAAAIALFESLAGKRVSKKTAVSVTLPRGCTLTVPLKSVEVSGRTARATVVKDAGDDPDVTNRAEFVTGVEFIRVNPMRSRVIIRGGDGVGVVTRPGLKTPVGRPAINPVPLMMIRGAVLEAARGASIKATVVVTVTVPMGAKLAEKTMNPRLGIVGGISILGTTGIVEPMSLAAYTHSISCAADVAVASGLDEVVFSTGRSSEKVVEKSLGLPPLAYVLTGDHMGFALREARGRKGLARVTVAGQFGKFTKLASGHFETHCTDSSVEFEFLAGLCRKHGATEALVKRVLNANTAREVYFILKDNGLDGVFKTVTGMVRKNSKEITGEGIEVAAVLVGYDNDIVGVSRTGAV